MIAIYELNDIRPLIDLYVKSYSRTCEMYRATFDALGFDELRVRYRQQRRDLIRHIILHELHSTTMDKYIQQQAEKRVKKHEVAQFVEDVYEDLEQISLSRIAGMDITQQQLRRWKKN